ncbi:DUF6293 family protein [Halobium salinum]|uniref:DUF6293 family protein n=1 Tax=Halobium salinum TaxID=1364940 RepID=A0ABD5PEG8_9EURY|nr:DUF6293 family protein [Halobium salinum]
MSETVHIIPVGFDYERLLLPISQGGLEADRILLLQSSEDSGESAEAVIETMVDRLEHTFRTVLGKEVEIQPVKDIYDYKSLYREAHRQIREEVDSGNDVWVNISSMPRTVAFAFATAANSLIVERPELRESIHTYYVSPEEYLVTEMIGELREQKQMLQELGEDYNDDRIQDRLQAVDTLLEEVDQSGVTKGASRLGNGQMFVEFPAAPLSDLREFEREILYCLYENGPASSTSALARLLAEQREEKYQSLRSKVQYNVRQLEDEGYIRRTEKSGGHETRLSTIGELWVETHFRRN